MNRIVASSLRQRFLVVLMTLVLIGAGSRSLDRLPVDAYPDLSPPMVEIITQWPGHAAEEVERLITVPVEAEMNGIPQMTTIRSISLYGLSDVILTFQNGTDNYFARQQVFNRLRDLSLPSGVTPVGVAAVLAFGSDLSLRAAKPRPLADGAQDLRGLDRRARNTNPFPAWRMIRASAAAPCSTRCCSIRPRSPRVGLVGAAGGERADGQQRQRRRRVLFARRPVLLRARPGPHRRRWRTSATWCWRCITARRCWSRTSAAWSSASRRAWASSATRNRTTRWKASSCCAPAKRPRTC